MLVQQEEAKYVELFAGFYTQPELVEAAAILRDTAAHTKFSVRELAAEGSPVLPPEIADSFDGDLIGDGAGAPGDPSASTRRSVLELSDSYERRVVRASLVASKAASAAEIADADAAVGILHRLHSHDSRSSDVGIAIEIQNARVEVGARVEQGGGVTAAAPEGLRRVEAAAENGDRDEAPMIDAQHVAVRVRVLR